MLKLANTMVDSGEFESSFSQLARRKLQNRSRQAAEREVGFQLLDKNDEGDWAVGVFGIRTGSKLSLVPCFFLDGEVKVDLMYLPDRDQFCPLSDKWVSAAARLDRSAIGRVMPRNETNKYPGFVDLTPFAFPRFKSAAVSGDDRADFRRAATVGLSLLKRARTQALLTPDDRPASLKEWIHKHGQAGFRAFARAVRTVPAFGSTVEMVYPGLADELVTSLASLPPTVTKTAAAIDLSSEPTPLADITRKYLAMRKNAGMPVTPGPRGRATALLAGLSWVKSAATKAKRSGKGPIEAFIESHKSRGGDTPTDEDVPKVDVPAVITRSGQAISLRKSGLFNEQRLDEISEAIARTGRHVHETRTKTAAVVEDGPLRLKNPTSSGVYSVLVSDNEYKDMLVLTPIVTAGRAASDRCIVLPLRSPGSEAPWSGRIQDVLVADDDGIEGPKEKFKTWFAGKRKTGTKLDTYTTYLFIDQTGRATEVLRVADGPSRDNHYTVCASRESDAKHESGSRHEHQTVDRSYGPRYDWRDSPDDTLLRMTGEPGRGITIYDGTLQIPSTAVAVKFDGEVNWVNPLLRNKGLATPSDLQRMYFGKSAQLYVVKTAANELTIDGLRFSSQDAFDHLVTDWDLSGEDAEAILAKADRAAGGSWSYRVLPAPDVVKAAVAPPFPTERQGVETGQRFALPATYPTEEETRNPTVRAPQTDYYGDESITPYGGTGVDRNDSRILGMAAEAGPGVFDTSAISVMLREPNEQRMIDDGLPELYRGMNRLGRYRFALCAHPDKLKDRYGEKDLDTFEDTLISVFEQTGDVILFLRQTDANPFPDGSPTDIEV